jgi:hypothetical protein
MASYRGAELEYLLAPISLADFFREYWDKKALYIPGTADKFSEIYDVDRWRQSRRFRELVAATVDDRGLQREYPIEPDLIDPLYRAGLTICADVSDDPRLSPFLRGFCARLKLPGGPGFAKLYASADDRGFAVHCDKYHVFVMQIDGRKRWRFSRTPAVPSADCGGALNEAGLPVFTFPRQGVRMTSHDHLPVDPPQIDRLEEALLGPGDCLYLPPGTWHVARASGHSMAVSISPPRTTIGHLIMRSLEQWLLLKPEWRADALAMPGEHGEPGKIARSLEEQLAARIAELRTLLDRVDQRLFHREWALDVATGNAPDEPEPAIPADLRIDPADVFVHREGDPLTFLVAPTQAGKDEVLFYHRGSEWGLPIEALAFASQLVKHPEFRARNAQQWDRRLSWEEVQSILLQLLQAGLIRFRPRPT